MYITGTLLVQNSDYLQSVSAVDIDVNGSSMYIAYLDSTGKLKATSSHIATTNNVAPAAMSGCAIVQ